MFYICTYCIFPWWDSKIGLYFSEVGDLILFPSYILHQPNKNESEEMRVSIAYNFLPSRINLKDKPPWTMELNL